MIVGQLEDPAGVHLDPEEGPLPFPIPPCAEKPPALPDGGDLVEPPPPPKRGRRVLPAV